MSRKKKMLLLSAAGLAVLTIVICCIVLAYLTHTDEVVNTFSVGDVEITLSESNYPGNGTESTTNLTAYSEVSKNPTVKNTGINSAYVFLVVTVPVDEVTEVGADGTRGDKKRQELFYLKQSAQAQSDCTSSFNTAWVKLEDKESGRDYSGSTRTYVFGYRKALAENETTEALFDKIQLKNTAELASTSLTVNVKACAIQAEYLENAYPESGLTSKQLSEIYSLIE